MIGTFAPVSDQRRCAGQAAYDRISHRAYHIDFGDTGYLRSIDLTTGASTAIGPFVYGSTSGLEVDSLAIGLDGTAYVLSRQAAGYVGTGVLRLDLTTGELTALSSFPDGRIFTYGFSVDPTSGDFYVVNANGAVSKLDVVTGVLTPVGTIPVEDGGSITGINSISIDGAGTLWFQGDVPAQGPPTRSVLWSTSLTDPAESLQRSGFVATDAEGMNTFYLGSFFVGPAAAPAPAPVPVPVDPQPAAPATSTKPVLAETGVNDAAVAGRIASAALALILGGAALTVARSRRKGHA